MKAFVIVFIIISTMVALFSLGYAIYDVIKEKNLNKAAKPEKVDKEA